MEDSTSPSTTNTSPTVWPTPAVPGKGIPWRRSDQQDTQSPASGAAEHPAEAEADGDRPQTSADAAVGDRPRDVPGTRSPHVPVPESTSGANPQASGGKSGTGPQEAVVAPGDRSGDGEHGPRQSVGTDTLVAGTAQQEGTGPVDARGPDQEAGPRPPRGPAAPSEQGSGEGAELLDELRAAIGKYVVLPSDEALTAVTLWVAATHIQSILQHAPRLAVVGPTKGCGKSRVLDVLHETVHQPIMTVNMSTAVLFRVIGKNPRTILVDEADTIFSKAGENEELRGLLNAGHQRNRPAWRISGPEHKPTPYPTFAMAALASIGDLPDTITDRAVVLRMQKRKPGEKVTPFRSRYATPELNALRDKLAAWLGPLRGTAGRMAPTMPVEDRAADTWEPLVIIADLAGGHWPARARAACVAMTRYEAVQDEQTNLKTRLLRDIHRIFQAHGNPEAMSSLDLVTTLLQDADAPWAEHGTKGLNAHHLGNMLRDFGISPANYRFDKGRQAKGYARNRFLDSWARHCPDLTETAPAPAHDATPAHRAQGKPPAAPAGQLPVGPPGGPTGPTPAR
ncbi:hypothetical protein DWG14_03625 [Streptomyces griseorubiginosus]|uniref:DUF3631 domain-containing protein n=1 Tax=Streptomyces griseorubiginosus TaxID=67304 RepID=A0AAI8L102_9ACTN|nr:hypothetical protein DWG14_03625 [Streptomyces griseorubiginosus]